jgi:cell division protein FtsB
MKAFWERSRSFIVVAGIVLLIIMVLNFNQRMTEMMQATTERDKLATQAASLKATESVLEAELNFVNSNQSVERWAREDGHMVKSGDHAIIMLPDTNATPEPAPIVIPQQKELSNPEVWDILFFGEE